MSAGFAEEGGVAGGCSEGEGGRTGTAATGGTRLLQRGTVATATDPTERGEFCQERPAMQTTGGGETTVTDDVMMMSLHIVM